MNRFILVALIVVSLGATAHAAPLEITSGSMQLGGTAAFQFEKWGGEKWDGVTGMRLWLSPEFGYFLTPGLELLANLDVLIPFGDKYEANNKDVGFGFGARYLLSNMVVTPYFGLGIGMKFVIPDSGNTTKGLLLKGDAGVLWGLCSNLALDFGVRATYVLSLEKGGKDDLHLPVGFLGVQGYF